MKKSLLALASVLVIAAGCAKEKFDSKVTSHSGIKEITASLDEMSTKTYLGKDAESYKLFWFPGETITVGATDQFTTFTLTEGENTPKGKFSSPTDLPSSEIYYAVSPEMYGVTSSGDTLKVNYPSELEYVADSQSAEGGEVMVARSCDSHFSFQNAIGYIKFQLAVSEEEILDKIEVSDKLGNFITGEASVIFDENRIAAIEFSSEGSSTVTVNFAEQVTISPAEPFVTFIPVAPMEDGIAITVTMRSGKSMTMTSSTQVKIGQIVELPTKDFVPVEVAEVGSTKYYSFKQAVQAADELGQNATIRLIADCNVGADCEISSTREITVDLNGHTLNGVGDNYLSVGKDNFNAVITDSSAEKTGTITNTNSKSTPFRVYGHTTIKGGNIVSGTNYGVYVHGGSLIMEGGTINSGSAGIYIQPKDNMVIDSVVVKGDALIKTESTGILLNSKGTSFIMRGGEVLTVGAHSGVYAYDGLIKIYDGTIGAKSYVVCANKSYDNQLDIYGGKFHKDSINAIVSGHNTLDSTRVWGGYYTHAVSSTYIPEGYSIASCDTTIDGRHYTVTIAPVAEIQATVSINGGAPIEKATINEAFNAAIASGQDALITLVADCAPTDSMVLASPNKLTIDFNGKTLTCNSNKILRIVGENSDLTLKSSVEGGGIHQTSSGSGCHAFRQRGGKITVESGKYEGTSIQWTAYSTGGELIINGGEFYADTVCIWNSHNKLTVNGGKFAKRETSTKETKKIIYITTESEATFTGGSLSSVYVYDSDNKATFKDGTFDSFTIGGGNKDITFESGTYQNIHFEQTGVITVKGGTFNGRSYMDGSGTLNIEGGTFSNSDGYAMWPTAGKVNIKNATFNGSTSYGTLRFTKCTATIGEGTIVNSSHKDGNAVYVGSDNYKAIVTIDGGTFNAPKSIYGSKGSLTVNGGIFNSTGARVIYASANILMEVLGGYFNTTAETAIIEGKGLAGILKGGWFNKKVTESAINSSYVLDSSKSVEVAGVTYNYQVVENASAPDIATVNGVGYKAISTAIQAAKDYAGSENEVTVKLVSPEDTVYLNTTANFTNESGKPVKFDLNNHTLYGSVDSLITTQGVLTLTDESAEKGGTISSPKRRLITLNKVGTVNIKHITVDATKGVPGWLAAMYSVIVVSGTEDEHDAVLNVSDGARLLAKYYQVKVIYSSYSTVTMENCEIIAKYDSSTSSTKSAYPCVYAYSGANITIKSGTFMQSNGEGNSRGTLYIGTGNPNIGSSITVEDGAMIWGDGANGAIGSGESSNVPYTSKTLHLKGGYLNKYNNNYLLYTSIYSEGKSIQEITPVKEYTNSLGETKTFGYQIK